MPISIGLGLSAVGLLGKGINMYNVSQDQAKAQDLVNNIAKTPLSQYTADPSLLNYYSKNLNMANNPTGLTGGEKAGYRGNVATDVNTQFLNANRASGGNLGKFIGNSFAPNVTAGENQLVGQDATLKRNQENSAMGRLGSTVSALQSLKDKNVSMENERLLRAQQAAGQAVLQDKSFNQQSLEGTSSDLIGGGLMMGMKGLGKTSTPLVDPDFRKSIRFTPPTETGDPNYIDPELMNG